MTTLNIGYTRRVEVSIEVSPIGTMTADELTEGLTTGKYEVLTGTGEIIDCNGEVVATYEEYEENEETHSNFEQFE